MSSRTARVLAFNHSPHVKFTGLRESADWLGSRVQRETFDIDENRRLGVLEDGTILVEWSPGLNDISAELHELNALLCCFYAALRSVQNRGIPLMDLRYSDLFSAQTLAGPPQAYADVRTGHLHVMRSLERRGAGWEPNQILLLPLIDVERATLETTARLARMVFAGGARDIWVADLYLRAVVSLQQHDPSDSLLYAWTGTEHLLGRLWTAGSDAIPVNSALSPEEVRARAARRADFRTFSPAAMVESLFSQGNLSDEIYGHANRARQARNNWIHRLLPVEHEDAISGIRALEGLLQRAEIPLGLPWGLESRI